MHELGARTDSAMTRAHCVSVPFANRMAPRTRGEGSLGAGSRWAAALGTGRPSEAVTH